ncbi:imelysin family protein [Polaribacter cellanae]|uniref:Imelysin family protein n=1 Tax=Polaribacter cellanae TaxID=2818493 RepID=A0A975CT02_9FLAO|nr:imelysin family protein [Polaribacter cellanae]QTE23457.1 imelysin family protein [Polaribacter cellanae]
MFKKISLLFVAAIIFNSCSSGEEGGVEVKDNFDRKIMLTNIADNIITPSYDEFASKMKSLKSIGDTFINNPTQTTLEDLRVAWLEAYKKWQYIEMYNIGKAEEIQYSFYMNVYPLTVADVESNISSGSYDLNSANNHDAQGFPALDYLLYGVGDNDNEILAKFTTATNNDKYKKYLTDVLNQMNNLTKDVVAKFKANRNTFVNNLERTSSGTFNKIINDYVFFFEKGVRTNKFGIPAGIFSTNPLPEKVEAVYKKDVSKTLALEALTAVENLFNGNGSISFKDYLLALDRRDLATKIEAQFATAKIKINSLNTDFSAQIISDNSKMLNAYDELQKAIILLKVDMMQTFNIPLDDGYVDNDGD